METQLSAAQSISVQTFNWLDWSLVTLLLTGLVTGAMLGMIRQIVLLVSLVIGIALASCFTVSLAATPLFERVHAQLGLGGAQGIAYATILGGTLLVGIIGILILRRFLVLPLRFADRAVGGVFALGLGAALFGLFSIGVLQFPESWLHAPIRESTVGSQIAGGARIVTRMFPDEFRARMEESLARRMPEVLAGAKADQPTPKPPEPRK
ncbi:MAG: CvpA family protein [Planctomycetota bacterium]